MLASFMVHLRPTQPAPMDGHVGRWLHGLFFHLLAEADPALATRLHDWEGLKPFTVSSLMGRFEMQGGRRMVVPEESYRVRYTTLVPEILEGLGQSLLTRYLEQRPLRLDGIPFEIERIEVPPQSRDSWIALASYEQLAAPPRPAREIVLHFNSPTAFKAGDLHLLFPQPWNVFGSLARSWRAFSSIPLPEDVYAFCEKQVGVSRYELRTQVITGGRYQLLGFVGTCTYRILADDALWLRTLNTLADFALFAGVGLKTTQGMGQTQRTPVRG